MSDFDGWGPEPGPDTNYQFTHVPLNRAPAKKKYKKREADIQSKCVEYMTEIGFIVLRTNAGTWKTVEGNWIHGIKKGGADLHCCAAGLFLAVETKAPKNGLSADQKDYRAEVEAKGGTYIAPHSVDELRAGLIAAYGPARVAQWEQDAARQVDAKAQRRLELMKRNGQVKG